MRSLFGLMCYRSVLAVGCAGGLLYQVRLLTDPVSGNELLGDSWLNYLLISGFCCGVYYLERAAHALRKQYAIIKEWKGRYPYSADGLLGEHLRWLSREPLPLDLDQQASLNSLSEKQARREWPATLMSLLLPIGGVSITFLGVMGAMAKMAGAINAMDVGGEGPVDLTEMLSLLSGAIADLGVGFSSTLISSVLGALLLRMGVSTVVSMRQETFDLMQRVVDRQVLPVLREKARLREKEERDALIRNQAIETANWIYKMLKNADLKLPVPPAPVVNVPPPKVTWPKSLPITLDDEMRQELGVIASSAQTTAKIVAPVAPALIELRKTQRATNELLAELLTHLKSERTPPPRSKEKKCTNKAQ